MSDPDAPSASTGDAPAAAPIPRGFLQYVRAMGPGIVVVLTWLGAGDIVDASVSGGAYGYALMWVLVAALMIRWMFVSTIAQSQAQAMQLSFFFMLPNILLSGYMFPREAMPAPAQWIGLLLPLTYYLKILRGILLRGAGFTRMWQEALVLAVFATAVITLSVRRFSKTIG